MIPALTLLGRLRAIGAWLLRHPMAALAAIGAVVLLVLRRQRDSARGQRDAEHKRADQAEADAATVTETMEAREAGRVLAEEIRHGVPITDDAHADRGRLHERVREIARREGLPPPVSIDPAAGAGRGHAAGQPRGDEVLPRSGGVRVGDVARVPGPGLAAPAVTPGFEESEMIEELK